MSIDTRHRPYMEKNHQHLASEIDIKREIWSLCNNRFFWSDWRLQRSAQKYQEIKIIHVTVNKNFRGFSLLVSANLINLLHIIRSAYINHWHNNLVVDTYMKHNKWHYFMFRYRCGFNSFDFLCSFSWMYDNCREIQSIIIGNEGAIFQRWWHSFDAIFWSWWFNKRIPR